MVAIELCAPDLQHQEMVASYRSELALPDRTRALELGCGKGRLPLNLIARGRPCPHAYGDAKYARRVALKDTYDPANMLRLKPNIRPSHPAAELALA